MLFKLPQLLRITSLGFEAKSFAVKGHLAREDFKLKAVAALQSVQRAGGVLAADAVVVQPSSELESPGVAGGSCSSSPQSAQLLF